MSFKVIYFGILVLVLIELSVATDQQKGETSTSRRSTRSTMYPTEPTFDYSKLKGICLEACRWGVYNHNPLKVVELFIDNPTCKCAKGQECIRAEDQLSIASHVYRCHPPLDFENYSTASL